jgi:hypothetical protein
VREHLYVFEKNWMCVESTRILYGFGCMFVPGMQGFCFGFVVMTVLCLQPDYGVVNVQLRGRA